VSTVVQEKKKQARKKWPNAQFREADFVDVIQSDIQSGNHAAALTTLIKALPELGPGSRINRQEKLNHLTFMSKLLQQNGTKHGYHKLIKKARRVAGKFSKHAADDRGSYLDFGCGAHDPIALATYFYLNGFEKCHSVDMLSPRNEVYSALSMYDIIAQINLYPDEYMMPGTDRSEFLNRLHKFDAKAFSRGEFNAGFEELNNKIDYFVGDIVNAEIQENSVSLCSSFAVFEHVMELDAVLEFLFEKTAPGGLGFHFIDLADHRAYRADNEFNIFSFLTEKHGPSNINRLRKSELLTAFESAGWEIIEQSGDTKEIPDETRSNLLPRWKEMSLNDQETYNLTVVVRKPE